MIDIKQKPTSPVALLGDQIDEPQYPFGTRITLTNDLLQQLAMGMPQVGDVFTLDAMVEVVAVSKMPGNVQDQKQVELQITHMELKNPAEEMNEQQAAMAQIERMYG
jgi:hypothetical protein